MTGKICKNLMHESSLEKFHKSGFLHQKYNFPEYFLSYGGNLINKCVFTFNNSCERLHVPHHFNKKIKATLCSISKHICLAPTKPLARSRIHMCAMTISFLFNF